MSKAEYPYPADEFDAVVPDVPVGVHRAPRTAWSRWWPYLVVLLVVPVLAYGAVTFLLRSGDLPVGGDAGPGPQAEQPAPEDPAGEDPAAPADGTEAPPESEEPAPPPEPVLSTSVRVLNGARVSGLAARIADELEGAGFTDVTPDNATSSLPSQSTVYVASEELRPTAELVASTVGVTAIEVDPAQASGGIVVVLVSDPSA